MYDELIEGIMLSKGIDPTAAKLAIANMKSAGVIDTAGKLGPSGDRKQSILDVKIAQYADGGIVTSSSFLRAEFPLTGNFNTLEWNVLQNGGNTTAGEVINTQNLLNQNDTFTVLGYALYLKSAVTVGGAAPTEAEHAKAQLYTFPNPQIFVTANEANNLQAIYNGELGVKLDTTDFIPSFPALSFYRVPQSQQGVGGATGVIGVQRNEWPNTFYGRVEVQPSFEFSGQTQMRITEALNASIDLSSGIATRRNYAVLILTGLLHSGANNEFQKRQALAQKKRK